MGTTLKDLKTFLESLPCVREEARRHTRYSLKINNRIIAWTDYSRSWNGSTQIDDSTISKMGKQMKCSNNVLWKKLLAGQAVKDDYFRDLLNNGHINQDEFNFFCINGKTTKEKWSSKLKKNKVR